MGYWQKYPKEEGQHVLETFHAHGWKITGPSTHYSARCPCGDHQTQVHLTPSNPRYWRNKLAWAERQPCWREDGR